MSLFEFELSPVEDIEPWGDPGNKYLSWFALTDGRFRIVAGSEVLFRYTEEVLRHWAVSEQVAAEYQVAAFARDFLGVVAAAVAPLPSEVEQLARKWDHLTRLRDEAASETDDEHLAAWRWVGERTPWTSYLAYPPEITFVRIGDDVRMHWDNRACKVDDVPVWTGSKGVHTLHVEDFLHECKNLAQRVLLTMEHRIRQIELGTAHPRAPVSSSSLWEQHETWRNEFASYFRDHVPEVPWSETQAALLKLESTQLS